jgi:hypothetical protein
MAVRQPFMPGPQARIAGDYIFDVLWLDFPEKLPQGGVSVSARYIANVRNWHLADMA